MTKCKDDRLLKLQKCRLPNASSSFPKVEQHSSGARNIAPTPLMPRSLEGLLEQGVSNAKVNSSAVTMLNSEPGVPGTRFQFGSVQRTASVCHAIVESSQGVVHINIPDIEPGCSNGITRASTSSGSHEIVFPVDCYGQFANCSIFEADQENAVNQSQGPLQSGLLCDEELEGVNDDYIEECLRKMDGNVFPDPGPDVERLLAEIDSKVGLPEPEFVESQAIRHPSPSGSYISNDSGVHSLPVDQSPDNLMEHRQGEDLLQVAMKSAFSDVRSQNRNAQVGGNTVEICLAKGGRTSSVINCDTRAQASFEFLDELDSLCQLI